MSELRDVIREAIGDGRLGPRLWLYSNYHCNLACEYCLTESAPGVPRRELDAAVMLDVARDAVDLGFGSVGITGGEPFLRPDLPALAAELSRIAPVLVLTNGTLFADERIDRLSPMHDADVSVQISLDAATPDLNDPMRGPGNFERVLSALPRLRERGIGVRIATTDYGQGDDVIAEVADLVMSLGVPEDDHIIRPTVARGRAASSGLGEVAGIDELPAEPTVTVDGLFWSPFAPTVRDGRLDTDLLVSRQVLPLEPGMRAFVGLLSDAPLAEAARFR